MLSSGHYFVSLQYPILISEPGLDICVWDAFKMIIFALEGDIKDETKTTHGLSPNIHATGRQTHSQVQVCLCLAQSSLPVLNQTQIHEHLQMGQQKDQTQE